MALYADASYFLIYSRISGGVSAVAKTFGAEVETARLVAMHVDPAVAAAASDPMPLTTVPLFNPQGAMPPISSPPPSFSSCSRCS
ncbi:hypothetical protein LZK76_33865 (plasmid) [Rhizobium leguminosarum]|nr:hypothetical protein LZK76_33865 [Rhizobium leguminosarum]